MISFELIKKHTSEGVPWNKGVMRPFYLTSLASHREAWRWRLRLGLGFESQIWELEEAWDNDLTSAQRQKARDQVDAKKG
jgi:hypothetical protein